MGGVVIALRVQTDPLSQTSAIAGDGLQKYISDWAEWLQFETRLEAWQDSKVGGKVA